MRLRLRPHHANEPKVPANAPRQPTTLHTTPLRVRNALPQTEQKETASASRESEPTRLARQRGALAAATTP